HRVARHHERTQNSSHRQRAGRARQRDGRGQRPPHRRRSAPRRRTERPRQAPRNVRPPGRRAGMAPLAARLPPAPSARRAAGSGRVVTRDEVARECEKLGWKLEEWIGPEVVNAPGPYYAVTDGPRILAGGNDAKTAYLRACAAEGRSPF